MANAPTGPFPATVQIGGLPLGTTPTGAELMMVTQTTSGVGQSVQITLSQAVNILPGLGTPFLASSVLTNAFVYGQGSAMVALAGPATVTGSPLLSNGSVAAPSFGIVGFVAGGTGTSTLSPTFGVVLAGTTALSVTSTQSAGQLLVGQTATSFPTWQNVGGDITLSSAGTATVTTNAVTFSKMQQVGPGTLLGNSGAGTTNISALTAPVLGTGGATGSLGLAGSNTSVVTLSPGTASFTSYSFLFPAAMGASGAFLISQGANTAPIFTTVVPSGVVAIAQIQTSPAPYSFDEPINFGFTPSVSAGVLTITLTNSLGSTPTATSPILIPFRSSLGTAIATWAAITGSSTLTTVVGATFGAQSASTAFRLWLAMFRTNATTVIPTIINCSNVTAGIFPAPTYNVGSPSVINATSNTAGIFYGNATSANNPYRLVGFLEWGGGVATIGTFSTTPTLCAYVGPDTPKPGGVVQTVFSNASTSVTFTTVTATTITSSITPISAANLIKYTAMYSVSYANATGVVTSQVFRGVSAIGAAVRASGTASCMGIIGYDQPNTTSATTYLVKAAVNVGSATIPGGNPTGYSFLLEEIMG